MSENTKVERMLAAEASHGSRHVPVSSAKFAIRNLSVLAYANGFTLWHYKGIRQTLVDVVADGFFNDAADMVALRDIIMVGCPDGARIVTVAEIGVERVVVEGLV